LSKRDGFIEVGQSLPTKAQVRSYIGSSMPKAVCKSKMMCLTAQKKDRIQATMETSHVEMAAMATNIIMFHHTRV
jgi:hypothetical protein